MTNTFVPIETVAAGSLPWLSVEQMRQIDRIMVEDLGISLMCMMENAGRNLAQLARLLVGGDARGSSILAMSGPGENGGGGLVAARHLANAGAAVTVSLGQSIDRMAPVPLEQLAILKRLGVPVYTGAHGQLGDPDLVLDALLGYSQHGDPYGDATALIEWSAGRRVLALDVPSGLELATGNLRTPHVTAEATMTLAAPKAALATAVDVVGRLYVADISVPPLAYEQLGLAYETPFGRGSLIKVEDDRILATSGLRSA